PSLRTNGSQLGIRTRLHSMRHYSATELLASGVDLRTVAGRLGHGPGGAITLRVYAAWMRRPIRTRRGCSLLACPCRGRPEPAFGISGWGGLGPWLDGVQRAGATSALVLDQLSFAPGHRIRRLRGP